MYSFRRDDWLPRHSPAGNLVSLKIDLIYFPAKRRPASGAHGQQVPWRGLQSIRRSRDIGRRWIASPAWAWAIFVSSGRCVSARRSAAETSAGRLLLPFGGFRGPWDLAKDDVFGTPSLTRRLYHYRSSNRSS